MGNRIQSWTPKRDPEAEARARAFALNTRLKFERVYESARKAIAEGDTARALVKCRAALDLLNQEDLYGPSQQELADTLGLMVANLEHPHDDAR